MVIRLDQRIPRRPDGSIDAGTKNASGVFLGDVYEIDRIHACYVFGVAGSRHRVGDRVTVKVLVGDGHDAVGHVHDADPLVVHAVLHRGHHRAGGVTADEQAAALRLGCFAGRG